MHQKHVFITKTEDNKMTYVFDYKALGSIVIYYLYYYLYP